MFIRIRGAAVVAALASGVAGVALVAAPAQAAAFGSCDVTIAGSLYTLTADCEVTSAIDVPDGVTLDGAGHTITAVEGTTDSYAGGSVLRSAVGDASGPATLNVRNLHIDTNFTTAGGGKNSGGTLNGIYMLRAGGTIDNVSIDSISHGNGVQEGIALWIRNRDLSAAPGPDQIAVPEAVVTVKDSSITRYQKGGLILDGNVKFTVSGLTVGRGTGPNGELNDGIAANAVQVSRGAHGSLTDSTVAPNFWKGRQTATDDYATGILVWDANKVILARNIVSGVKGNVGIDVSEDGTYGTATDVTVSCSLVQITGAETPFSVGVSNWDAQSKLALRDSTVTGFATNVSGTTATTGNSDCLAPAPKVKAFAGDHAVDVVWTRAAAPAYARVTGQVVVLSAPGEPNRSQTFDATGDSAAFTGLTAGATYTATVSVTNPSGDATGTATAKIAVDPIGPAVAQTITLSRNHKTIVEGHKVVFTGKLTPARAGTTVYLTTRSTGHFVTRASTVVKADGSFKFSWKATKPYGTHHFKVRSAAATGFLEGYSHCRDVKVKKH